MGAIFPGSNRVHGPNMLNQFSHTDAELGILVPDYPVALETDDRDYGPNYLYPYPHTIDGEPVGASVEERAALKIAALHPVDTPHGDQFRRDNQHLLK